MSDSDESDTDAPSPTEFVAGRLVARSGTRSAVVSQPLDEDDNGSVDLGDDEFIDDDDDESEGEATDLWDTFGSLGRLEKSSGGRA